MAVQKIEYPKSLLSDKRCKELANLIRNMAHFQELIDAISVIPDMDIFCGCKKDSSLSVKEDGAKDQWRAIKKSQNYC